MELVLFSRTETCESESLDQEKWPGFFWLKMRYICDEPCRLLCQKLDAAVVIDHSIDLGDLFLIGYLIFRPLLRIFVASGPQSVQPNILRAGYQHQIVEAILQTCFKEQGNFKNEKVICAFICQSLHVLQYQRMQQGIQETQFRRLAENLLCQSFVIYRTRSVPA